MATVKAKPQRTVLTFNPKRMKYDKRNPKVIYDSTRKLSESAATTEGYIYIGVKDKPSALDIKDTIKHEACHTGHKVAKTYLQAARQELQAYEREKAKSSPREWNRVLPMRINDFLPSISYLTKGEQGIIKSEAKSVLSPQVDGGNEGQVELALRKLGKFWIEEESTKPMQIVYHGTDEAAAKKILKKGFRPSTFFALHLEDSLGFGGTHIFEVAVESDKIRHTGDLHKDWEFIATDKVPPSQIVALKHYPKAKLITENKELGDLVFRSNLRKSELPLSQQTPMSRLTMVREPRGKIVKGVGYVDKSSMRLSRKHHRGFKRVRFT